jgi:3-demethylubiquinone-9 3-methyltransferase/sugar-phosphate isomerase family protein
MDLRFIKDMEDYQYILKHKKSAFSSVFRDKIIDFTETFDEPEYYESELIAFPFFEDYYYAIIKNLIKNNIKFVTDVGCQLGLQSELFVRAGIRYTGIDDSTSIFFNNNCSNVMYVSDNFMNVNIKNKVCIASMSVGYFSDDIYSDDDYIKKLSECKRLYIVSTPKFIDKLKLSMNLVDRLYNISLDIEKDKDLSISDGYIYVFEKK